MVDGFVLFVSYAMLHIQKEHTLGSQIKKKRVGGWRFGLGIEGRCAYFRYTGVSIYKVMGRGSFLIKVEGNLVSMRAKENILL